MPHERSCVRTYTSVYVVLLVLVALTVEAARHDLGRWNFVVAVLIAADKAFLIALHFMHVRRSTPLTKLVLAAGLLLLAILFALSLADYWSRNWLAISGVSSGRSSSGGWAEQGQSGSRLSRADASVSVSPAAGVRHRICCG